MTIDLSTLNKPQKRAVECTDGPLLVLAGAGSGKTRVLTYRIAHLIEDEGVAPWEILAITFTNKAALEMRERLGGLIGEAARGMWVSTFHSMCLRMLKANPELIGFSSSFTIYDTEDQKSLIKAIMRELSIDYKQQSPVALLGHISSAKNDLIVPSEFEKTAAGYVECIVSNVYTMYQKRLKSANAMDFDDLLLYAYLLLKHHPEVLDVYQKRFRYILVDEYQDTNHAQYAITKMLASKSRNIMVVGDDDQSIYSWRGADISNILNFEKDYPEANVVKLEQNYRSCGNILKSANAVIANNSRRKAKKLFTDSDDGALVGVYMAIDERDEGRWIASEIDKLSSSGSSYNQIAVFYRTNAQSRVLEDMFIRAGIPYRIVGGTRFFDRKEVRDVMAYLSLVVNPADDVAFTRIINTPRRGIGKTTIARITELSRQYNMPMSEACELLLIDDEVRPKVKESIGSFVQTIKNARNYSGDIRKAVERIVDDSKMIEAYQLENTDDARARIENIRELFGVVEEFADTHSADDALFEPPKTNSTESEPSRELFGDSLSDLIEWLTLRSDIDAIQEGSDAVTLMTIHSAKGLEFDNVFVSGMEEGVFPHYNSSSDIGGIEEERRLAYVAITRARKRLTLTCASTRQLYGSASSNPISRFITEIPQEYRETKGLGSEGFSGSGWEKRGSRRGISGSGREAGNGAVSYASSVSSYDDKKRNARTRSRGNGKRADAKVKYRKGDRIDHKTFGRGTVTGVDADTILVRFDKTGQTKKLLVDFAPIVKI